MAVPSSGSLSLFGIAKEVKLNDYNNTIPVGTFQQYQANPISLGDMSTGGGSFPNINTSNPSSDRPDGNQPHAMSEFYAYDQDLVVFDAWVQDKNDLSITDATIPGFFTFLSSPTAGFSAVKNADITLNDKTKIINRTLNSTLDYEFDSTVSGNDDVFLVAFIYNFGSYPHDGVEKFAIKVSDDNELLDVKRVGSNPTSLSTAAVSTSTINASNNTFRAGYTIGDIGATVSHTGWVISNTGYTSNPVPSFGSSSSTAPTGGTGIGYLDYAGTEPNTSGTIQSYQVTSNTVGLNANHTYAYRAIAQYANTGVNGTGNSNAFSTSNRFFGIIGNVQTFTVPASNDFSATVTTGTGQYYSTTFHGYGTGQPTTMGSMSNTSFNGGTIAAIYWQNSSFGSDYIYIYFTSTKKSFSAISINGQSLGASSTWTSSSNVAWRKAYSTNIFGSNNTIVSITASY